MNLNSGRCPTTLSYHGYSTYIAVPHGQAFIRWSIRSGSRISAWSNGPKWKNVVLHQLPARAERVPFQRDLTLLKESVERPWHESLYAHQLQASNGLSQVVILSSLRRRLRAKAQHNLPVLNQFARNPEARAIYLFPTKALARDQEEALRALMNSADCQGHHV